VFGNRIKITHSSIQETVIEMNRIYPINRDISVNDMYIYSAYLFPIRRRKLR